MSEPTERACEKVPTEAAPEMTLELQGNSQPQNQTIEPRPDLNVKAPEYRSCMASEAKSSDFIRALVSENEAKPEESK
jgi:hypothetical protein